MGENAHAYHVYIHYVCSRVLVSVSVLLVGSQLARLGGLGLLAMGVLPVGSVHAAGVRE